MKVIIEGIKGIQKVYSMLVGSCWHHNILQPSQKHSASRIHPARAFSVSHWVRRVTDPGSNGLAQLYTPAAQWSRNAWDSGDEPRGELALNFCTARKLPVLCLCFFACTELQVTHPETLPTSPTSQYLCHSRPPFLPTNKFKGG